MGFKKKCLKKGIKVGYREKFDSELAEIASTLFGQNNLTNEMAASYKLEFIKARHNCKVYMLTFENEVYFLKKFFEPTFHKKLLNVFRTSKAFRCYETSFKLASINIPVAEPVMYLTSSKRMIENESVFITKKATGIGLGDFLMSQDIPSDKKEEAVKRLFQLLGQMCKKRFRHGDPCLFNYLIAPQDGGGYAFTFLDLDSVHRMPYMPVYLALHCLAKIRCFGGGDLLEDKWPTYVKAFLDTFNPRIELAKAICDIKRDKVR